MRLRGGWVSAKLTQRIGTGKFLQVAPQRGREAEHGARVILENSTVCHSRRISLLCPVDAVPALVGVVLMVSLTMILTIVCVSCQASLFLAAGFVLVVGVVFQRRV